MLSTRTYEQITETAAWLTERASSSPKIAMILGSGLGAMADTFEDATAISYDQIPNFPTSTVEGHAGQLVFGKLGGQDVVAMQGRFHFYEGWSLDEVTFPVRVFHALGCHTAVITNAAGGITPGMRPGDLMLITDHLNLTGVNPLRGPNDSRFGPRFPDMTEGYTFALRKLAMDVARELELPLRLGVYAGVQGPSYETPAEIKMLRTQGADAVGMSTVPEVIIASHCGMRVLGISCITNMAAGLSDLKLSHDEVTETATLVRERFQSLVRACVSRIEAP